MTIFITIIHIIVCLVLILVILVQGGRGQGITGPSFGSGNVQSLFGTRAGDFLTKATSISAICFLFTCIGLNMIETHKSKSLLESSRSKAPVDLDAIKKALEKIKAGKGVTPSVTTEKAADGSTILKVTQDKALDPKDPKNVVSQELQKIISQASQKSAEAQKTSTSTAATAQAQVKATASTLTQNAQTAASSVKSKAADTAKKVS